MSDHHILVIDAFNDDEVEWHIVCPTTRCGWQECPEDHPEAVPCHECPLPDECRELGACDDVSDGDEAIFHGVLHTYRYGGGWTVEYPGCAVNDCADGSEAWDIAHDKGAGRWPIDVDFPDYGDCYITPLDEVRGDE